VLPVEKLRSPVFATTCWTQVLAAGNANDPAAGMALERLCGLYWFPLYAFVRREGYGADHAQDLVQGFFAHILRRNDLAGLVRGEGKFRSFLLKAITHYLINERERDRAQKRGGDRVMVSIDDEGAEDRYQREPFHEDTPEKLFERRWAIALLDRVMCDLEREQVEAGKGDLFAGIKVFLSREPDLGEYAEISARFGIQSGTLAVTVHRLRQRYRELVRAAVADTVDGPLEVEAEMRHLMAALS
jgi:DNA-directed RNA polymerase specialized sigma24 family protein